MLGPPLLGPYSWPTSYPTSLRCKNSADDEVVGGVLSVAPRDSLRCERCGADDPPDRTVCDGPCQRWVGEECYDMYGQHEVYCFDCRPPRPTTPTPESALSSAQPCDICRQDWRDAGWQCWKCDGFGQGCSGASLPYQQTGLVTSASRPRHAIRDVRSVDAPNFACRSSLTLGELAPAAAAPIIAPRRGDGQSHGGAVARPGCSPSQCARRASSGPPLLGFCSRASSYSTSSRFKDSADEHVAGGLFGVAPRDSLRCERCGADEPPDRTVCDGPCQR